VTEMTAAEAFKTLYKALYVIAHCDINSYTKEQIQSYAAMRCGEVEVALLESKLKASL